MKYRKKPVVIEAIRLSKGSLDAAALFLGGETQQNIGYGINYRTGSVTIVTLEGTMHAKPGDWIIKGIKGEFYPCKHDIFVATYEAVTE